MVGTWQAGRAQAALGGLLEGKGTGGLQYETSFIVRGLLL